MHSVRYNEFTNWPCQALGVFGLGTDENGLDIDKDGLDIDEDATGTVQILT